MVFILGLTAYFADTPNHALHRIRAPLGSWMIWVIHCFLSCSRPLSARIGELGR